jgi:transposase
MPHHPAVKNLTCSCIRHNYVDIHGATPDRPQGGCPPRPSSAQYPVGGRLRSLFREHDFFDPRDLIQVKYEMVRRVRAEGLSVTTATEDFGLSRPTFYEAQTALKRDGLAGLLPKKRGPRGAHKLGAEVVAFLQRAIHETPSLRAPTLVDRIEERFGIRVHPRSIERALRRGQEKKRL